MIALNNKCIEINQSSHYVSIVNDISELSRKMTNFSKTKLNSKAKIDWISKRVEFIQWCSQMKCKINKNMGAS